MSHLCPICKNDISNLVGWKNLIAQLDQNIMLFCPYCNVGLRLEHYEEYHEKTNEVYEIWTFSLATIGD